MGIFVGQQLHGSVLGWPDRLARVEVVLDRVGGTAGAGDNHLGNGIEFELRLYVFTFTYKCMYICIYIYVCV